MYQECSSPCGRTCADLRLDGASSCPSLDNICVSGCNCPEGLVLDDGGQCVPPGVCPCQHSSQLYPAGSKIRQGCNAWCVPWGSTSGGWWGQDAAGGAGWWQETSDEIPLWPVCDGTAG